MQLTSLMQLKTYHSQHFLQLMALHLAVGVSGYLLPITVLLRLTQKLAYLKLKLGIMPGFGGTVTTATHHWC